MRGLKIGRLNFDVLHGFLGLFCLASVCFAILTLSNAIIFSSVALTSILAFGSIKRLKLAPVHTVIAPGITAPHREAFKRTISVCVYVNFRILYSEGYVPSHLAYTCACCAWVLWFLPLSDFDNGNTYIFGVPIFVGCTFDALGSLGIISPGHDKIVTTRFMLATQLSLLVIAFGFTLSFRKYIDIKKLYAASAGVIAVIVSGFVVPNLPLAFAVGVAVAVFLYVLILALISVQRGTQLAERTTTTELTDEKNQNVIG